MLFNTLLVIILSVSGVLSHGESEWGVTYTPERICTLKGSSVDMSCSYSYPTDYTVQQTFWYIHWNEPNGPVDLSQDPQYSDRVKYLGDKNSHCTFRINQLKESDSAIYYFRFLTDRYSGKYTGLPGVLLTVTGLQVKVTENEAQSVTMTCSSTCTLSGSPTFTWYKNGIAEPYENEYSLNLASTDDTDLYSCATGGVTSPAVNVKCVKVEITSSTVSEGEWVTLTCKITCTDLTSSQTFIWYKNGQSLQNTAQTYENNNYHKFIASSGDAGSYSCAVRGHENLLSPAVTLDVRYPPKSVSVSVSPSGEIVEGSSVTLTCSSSHANPPTQRYTWVKNRAELSWSSNTSNTIKSITQQDAGEYYCEAGNGIGKKTRSPPKHLDVKYPPKRVSVSVSPSGEIVEDSSVTLTCSSRDANPPVETYTWYKNNKPLSSETGGPVDSYTINSVTLQDAGEYYCEAENGIGKKTRSPPKHLDVKYRPKSVSVSVPPSGEIVEGSSVTLTCSSSDANPPVQRYTWYKNSRAVSSETGGPEDSYTIKNITLQDAGEYYCEAQNRIGTERSPAKHLDVQYALKSVSVSVSPSGEIVEGRSVTLTCSSDADPPAHKYTWLKKTGSEFSRRGSEQSYIIKNITLQDAGEYYCEAENAIRAGRSPPKRLDVQYAPKNTSVSVNPSGEIVEGSSVTLTCSSDGNPPVQNYTWYKKNDTGVRQAESGQSLNFSNFRSWNRGEYYCEAQNRLGAQNASALLVTQGGQSLIAGAAVGVAAILALVFLGVVCVRRRQSTNETEGDRQGNKSPIFGNVSGMAMSHTGTQGTDRDDGEVPLYASVQPANTRNQEQVLYSTVQKPLPQCEEGVQYASIQFRPSSAAPRSPAPSVKEDCVLYSTLRKLDK